VPVVHVFFNINYAKIILEDDSNAPVPAKKKKVAPKDKKYPSNSTSIFQFDI